MELGKKYIVRWKFVLLLMFISIFIFCNGDYAYADVQKASTLTGTLGVNDGFQWTYDATTKTITVTGEDSGLEGSIYSNKFKEIENEYQIKLENIVFENCKFKGSFSEMFYNCDSLKKIDFINCDTTAVMDMGDLFSGCSSLETLDVCDFDTSNVHDMGGMFKGCSSL